VWTEGVKRRERPLKREVLCKKNQKRDPAHQKKGGLYLRGQRPKKGKDNIQKENETQRKGRSCGQITKEPLRSREKGSSEQFGFFGEAKKKSHPPDNGKKRDASQRYLINEGPEKDPLGDKPSERARTPLRTLMVRPLTKGPGIGTLTGRLGENVKE